MCGICGVLSDERAEIEPAVRRMMDAMIHRGPDDAGYEQLRLDADGAQFSAGFGFRRLSILDLTPAGHQPMFNPATGDCLVFNGEIYNFRQLRAQLMVAGIRLRSSGDTEVLLQALSTWGEHALARLDGMFALAFYQASTRRVLLARDPLGIKPLYVSETPRRLLFASEVRPLLASRLVSKDLDPAGVASFLMYGAPQDPLTVHRDIRSFPSGCYQWISTDVTSQTIKTLPPVAFWRYPEVDHTVTEADAVNQVRTMLDETVASHLASDVRTGCFLSAGIDSTAIAALATRHFGRVATYSVGFDSPTMQSETGVAAATARDLGSDHTEILLNERDIQGLWDGWLAAADRPSVDGLNSFIVCHAIRQTGVIVALSGLGADELFGGYSSFRRVRRLAPVLRLISLLPAGPRRQAADLVARFAPERYKTRLRLLAASGGSGLQVTIALRQLLLPEMLEALGLSASRMGLGPDYLPPDVARVFDGLDGDLFNAVSRAETSLYMGNTLLRDTDINSMAHSIEVRVPYIAPRFATRALAFSGRIRRGQDSTPKHLLRKAVADILPRRVLDRAKTGFTLPVNDWMFGSLRESCESAVGALANVPFLDHSATVAAWQTMVKNRNYSYWMKPMLLVSLGNYVSSLQRSE
jgi:asparagine synthase (glutamine-hydrolysing)